MLKYRDKSSLTQGALVAKFGSITSYIRFLEYGKYMPTLNICNLICSALEVNPYEFMSKYLQGMNRMKIQDE